MNELFDLLPISMEGGKPQPSSKPLTLETKYFRVTLSPDDGSLISLFHYESNRNWADPTHRLFSLTYESYSYGDYRRFCSIYTARCLRSGYDVCEDFAKLGMNETWAPSLSWPLQVTNWSILENAISTDIYLTLRFKDSRAVRLIGGATTYFIHYSFPHHSPKINIRVQWANKTATRLPEALWLLFQPLLTTREAQYWKLNIQESLISPLRVAVNGSRNWHAINTGARLRFPLNSTSSVQIVWSSLDAPLISPGINTILGYNGTALPNLVNGMHYNLHNNLWGTAFNQWYDQDASFRFTLQFNVQPNM